MLPGEIETEQHLRDPARRQRRANSSQPQPQGQAQAQANRSSGGSADEQAAEAPLRPPPPPPPLMPRDAEARPPLTMQRPSSRHLKVRSYCCRLHVTDIYNRGIWKQTAGWARLGQQAQDIHVVGFRLLHACSHGS